MGMRASPLVKRLIGFRPVVVDVLLAVSVAGITVAGDIAERPAGWPHTDAQGLVLGCLSALPTVLRRRAPMSVLVCCTLFSVWYVAAGYYPAANGFGPELAWYTVAASRPPRKAIPGAVLLVALWVYAGVAGRVDVLAVTAVAVVVTGVLWRFADGARRLADGNELLTALTEQLRQERDERARRAVTDERIRIARELHDVVAHHMSVISVQAGLARYVLDSAPATARGALDTVLDTAGEALEEMRRMLELLRIPDDPADDPAYDPAYCGPDGWDGESDDPAPGLVRLGELLDRVRAAGVPVELAITGPPRPLPPGVDLCVYRVVQESLTNVLKHARGARATVTMHYGTHELTARIGDDGHTAVPVIAPGTAGHGLMGMRERAKLYGGTLAAGPRPQGGFEVMLTVPVAAAAPVVVEPGKVQAE